MRVRSHFADSDRYDIQLVSPLGPGDGTLRLDHCLESPDEIADLLKSMGSGIVIPNYLWDLYEPVCKTVASGSDWHILGYCRADHEEEYYKPLRQRADVISHFIAVSPTCADHLGSYLPERRDEITTLPTGILLAANRSTSDAGAPLRITYAGRVLQHQKRVLDIPLIAQHLDQRGVSYHLTIAGDGDELPLIRKQLAKQAAQGKVTFRGKISPEKMDDIWSETDVTLLCSEFEGTSNSLLEAMGAGCVPVVTRTDSGVEGIVEHGVNGWLFETGDVQSAADHLQVLAADPELFRSAQTAAQQSVTGYSITSHCETLTHIFDQLMQQPARQTECIRYTEAAERRITENRPPSLTKRLLAKIRRTMARLAGRP